MEIGGNSIDYNRLFIINSMCVILYNIYYINYSYFNNSSKDNRYKLYWYTIKKGNNHIRINRKITKR